MLPSSLACRNPYSISNLRPTKVSTLGHLEKASFPPKWEWRDSHFNVFFRFKKKINACHLKFNKTEKDVKMTSSPTRRRVPPIPFVSAPPGSSSETQTHGDSVASVDSCCVCCRVSSIPLHPHTTWTSFLFSKERSILKQILPP